MVIMLFVCTVLAGFVKKEKGKYKQTQTKEFASKILDFTEFYRFSVRLFLQDIGFVLQI